MEIKRCYILYLAFFCMAVMGMNIGTACSKDAEPGVDEIIQNHIQSIAGPETVAAIRIRGVGGTAQVDFIQGGTGKILGQAMILSEKARLGIIMKFDAVEYPGEHFAFDGEKVMVDHISPGQRSPLADFIYRYSAIVKEGILGGSLSLNWPLLDAKKVESRLQFRGMKKIDDRELYVVEYRFSDRKYNDLKTMLYFDPETFRHVRTEYRISIHSEMGLRAGVTVMENGAERAANIQDFVPDSHYALIEKFSDFRESDGMMLPNRYDLEYSVEGQGTSFLANWTILAGQFMHSGKVDKSFYTADE